MNDQDRGALIGMVLGDGCLFYRERLGKDKDGIGKYKYVDCSIRIAHSLKQEEYCRHKRDRIHSIFGGKMNEFTRNTHTLSNGKQYQTIGFQKTHKYLRLLHRWMYSAEGKKYITRDVLEKLTLEGIAYWYMDDGSLTVLRNKRTGKPSSLVVRISTYVSEEEVDNIILFFKETLGITAKKGFCGRTEKFIVRIATNNSIRFLNMIYKYIHPSMDYKIKPVEDYLKHECEAS